MPLEISPEEFWHFAGYILSLANDYLGELDTLPSFPPDASGAEISQAFAEPLPQQGARKYALVALNHRTRSKGVQAVVEEVIAAAAEV